MPEDKGMDETSGPLALVDEVLAHLQGLLQLARNGPPRWVRYDLTFGQLRLLFVLSRGPISIGQLADMLSVTDATASEIVDRLERRGLAVRSHRSDDRRVVECQLSEGGIRLLGEIAGARRESMRAWLSVLTDEELVRLDGLLLTMAERLSAATQVSAPAEGGTQVDFGSPPIGPIAGSEGTA